MGKFVDFREVKAKVSIEQVLGLFDITGLKKQGSELRGKCFLHSGDGKRTLAVNLEKGVAIAEDVIGANVDKTQG